MDPLGFGLENYDGIGKWRTHGRQVPGGFQRHAAERQVLRHARRKCARVLKSQLPQFARCMVEKMLTYSLGRGLGPYDRRTVDEIDRKLGRRRLPVPVADLRNCAQPAVPVAARGERVQTNDHPRKRFRGAHFCAAWGPPSRCRSSMPWCPAFAAPRRRQAAVRMAFVYVPNGIDMRHWNPEYEGKLGELPRILKPLEPFKDDILLLGNLTHNTGRALLDGAGDHGRCCGIVPHRHPGQEEHGRYQGRRLDGPDRRQPDRQPDALPLARNRPGRRAPGRRLRFRLLLRVHQQPGVAQRDAAAAADSRSARAVRAPVRRRRGAEPRGARARRRSTAAAFSISSPTTPRSWKPASGPPTAASSTSISRPSARSSGRSRRPRRTTRRSIRTWTSRTACRPISPSTSG